MGDVPAGVSREAAQAGFAAWCQTSEDHRHAIAAVAAVDDIVSDLRHEPALVALGDAAIARAAAEPQRRRPWSMFALAGTVIVAPVAALTINRLAAPSSPAPAPASLQVISTAPGERRVVDLGSAVRVTLDTSSRLVVDGSTLGIRGQAYVSAGQTPVTIRLRNGTVVMQAGGLNVRTNAAGGTIFVESAMAKVRREGNEADELVLKPGYFVKVGLKREGASRAIDPAAFTSWLGGWLLFDDVPLAQAAAEINRYRHMPIKLAAGTRDLRISGSFRTDDAGDFLSAVAETLPATIARSPSGQATIVRSDATLK